MKKVFFPIFALLLITACEKEQVTTTETHEHTASALDRHANFVTVCHLDEAGQFQPMQVNANALQAHLAHGDYLPDADGDGYSAIDACTGSMDDCDDNNASIHPGATEICDDLDNDCDGQTDEGLPATTYYIDADNDGYGNPATALTDCSQPAGYISQGGDCDDSDADVNPGAAEICGNGLDDDCDGNTDSADSDCSQQDCVFPFFDLEFVNSFAPFSDYLDTEFENCDPDDLADGVLLMNYSGGFYAYAFTFILDGGELQSVVQYEDFQGTACTAIVGQDITMQQYEDTKAILRAAYAANPEVPHICGDNLRSDGNTNYMQRSGNLMNKIKKALPARLRERMHR